MMVLQHSNIFCLSMLVTELCCDIIIISLVSVPSSLKFCFFSCSTPNIIGNCSIRVTAMLEYLGCGYYVEQFSTY